MKIFNLCNCARFIVFTVFPDQRAHLLAVYAIVFTFGRRHVADVILWDPSAWEIRGKISE